jgi:organic radical activating enzyme
MKRYAIKEIFYSLQGEGVRAGTPNVFVRFAGCNLRCRKDVHGFDCDTDFEKGEMMTAEQVYDFAESLWPNDAPGKAVIFTGGEPTLQLDPQLIDIFSDWYLAIETNGTKPIPRGLDWVCVSPKPPDEFDIDISSVTLDIDELKYVIAIGQTPPAVFPFANNYLISPAHQPDGTMRKQDLNWCVRFVKENPKWRLSCQQHKIWSVR